MNRLEWILLLVLCWGGVVSEVEASYVQDMVKVIRTHKDYKVRMTALVALSKYSNPKIANLFLDVLRDRRENTVLRGMAARLLAQMRVLYAIPVLRKLSRSRNRGLRAVIQKAMRVICPRSTRGKRFYVNFDRAEGTGPFHAYAKNLAVMEFARIMAKKRPDVILGWPQCRNPSRRMLRRKRVKGFYIHIKVKIVKNAAGTMSSINLLYATFPKNAIKGMTTLVARTPSKPVLPVIAFLTKSLVQGLMSSVDQFLQ